MSTSAHIAKNVYSEMQKVADKKDIEDMNNVPSIETTIYPVSKGSVEQQDDSTSTSSVSEESGIDCEFECSSVESFPIESEDSFGAEDEPIQLSTNPIFFMHRTLYTIPEEEICINEELQVNHLGILLLSDHTFHFVLDTN